jgi:guanosine-3',5'-bis(diphosphate) 3'-pyrophosphohydrolase
VTMAHCCHPVPGDSILGYLGRGEGLLVHTADCSQGKRLRERDPEHFIQVDWSDQPTRPFEAAVHLLVNNSKGVLAQVAAAVAEAQADIAHLAMGKDPQAPTTELNLLVSVSDRTQLADVIRTLKRSTSVLRVARVKH